MEHPVLKQEDLDILIQSVLKGTDLFLVETELKGSQASPALWVYIESEKGNISLERCADISRELGFVLDASGWRDKKYTLNVSSPGLDRPLRDKRQYVNNIGRKADVSFRKDGKQTSRSGTLEDVQSNHISLRSDGNIIQIPWSEVLETRIKASVTKP